MPDGLMTISRIVARLEKVHGVVFPLFYSWNNSLRNINKNNTGSRLAGEMELLKKAIDKNRETVNDLGLRAALVANLTPACPEWLDRVGRRVDTVEALAGALARECKLALEEWRAGPAVDEEDDISDIDDPDYLPVDM